MAGTGKVISAASDRAPETKTIYRECNVDCHSDVTALNLCLSLDFLPSVRVGCDIKISISTRSTT